MVRVNPRFLFWREKRDSRRKKKQAMKLSAKGRLHDFAFEKLLVGLILNKIIMIWFFKPAPFS